MSPAGSRRVAHVLRLPGRALEAFKDHQPDRVHLRDHPVASSPDEGMWHQASQSHHDVQTRQVSVKEMATTQRTRADHIAHRGKEIRQRRTAGRRLANEFKTRLLRISRKISEAGCLDG